MSCFSTVFQRLVWMSDTHCFRLISYNFLYWPQYLFGMFLMVWRAAWIHSSIFSRAHFLGNVSTPDAFSPKWCLLLFTFLCRLRYVHQDVLERLNWGSSHAQVVLSETRPPYFWEPVHTNDVRFSYPSMVLEYYHCWRSTSRLMVTILVRSPVAPKTTSVFNAVPKVCSSIFCENLVSQTFSTLLIFELFFFLCYSSPNCFLALWAFFCSCCDCRWQMVDGSNSLQSQRPMSSKAKNEIDR